MQFSQIINHKYKSTNCCQPQMRITVATDSFQRIMRFIFELSNSEQKTTILNYSRVLS